MSELNKIYFPRTIPMAFLRGQKFTWQNNVNGGAISIADLNIKQQSFMGGNVTKLGWITELGLYACPNSYTQDIVALYVHDPLKLTAEGKALVRNAFPNENVIFDIYKEVEFTAEDRRRLYEDREYALQQGLPPEMVTHATSEELKGLIAARISGKAEKTYGIEVSTKVEPTLKEDAPHEHIGGVPKNTVLAGRAQPKRSPSHRK